MLLNLTFFSELFLFLSLFFLSGAESYIVMEIVC
jgi:hypothetical protein